MASRSCDARHHQARFVSRVPQRAILTFLLGGVALGACSGGSNGPSHGLSGIAVITQPPTSVQDRATIAPAPVVQLVDDGGQAFAKAGVMINVSLLGAGTLNGTVSVATDAAGQAAFPGLSIAGTTGSKQLRFQSTGLSAVNTANFSLTAGPAVQMVINGGNNQSALIGNAVSTAPSVMVTDLDQNGVAGVNVTFAVTGGGGSVTGPNQVTNSNGIATVGSWTLGTNAGPNTLQASATGLTSVNFMATGLLSNGQFTIKLTFLTNPTPAQNSAFSSAKARWESVIAGDLSNVTFNQSSGPNCGSQNVNETIDDVLILVDLVFIDGPGGVLGSAGPCFIRVSNSLPLLGYMKFDTADLATLETNGTLNTVILHEMGHVLGFGTLWTQPPFALLTGGGGADPTFNGPLANQAFINSNGGNLYVGTPIPVENSGGTGTRDAHWRETVFLSELMTGFLGGGTQSTAALSLTTIESLADMGYMVNGGAADPYNLATALRAPSSGVTLNLTNDILPVVPQTIDDRH